MTKEEIQKNSEHWYNKYKELEQENAELKNIICTHEYYQNGYKQGKLEESRKREVERYEIQGEVELRDVRIYDLNKKVKDIEQENATLRKQLEALSGDTSWNKLKDISEVTKQLTQAKEIIKGFIDAEDGSVRYYDLLNKAEQFLNDEVKE